MTLLHKLADEAAAPDGSLQVSFVSAALHELRVGLFREFVFGFWSCQCP
jgi:hypothetical protein